MHASTISWRKLSGDLYVGALTVENIWWEPTNDRGHR